MFRWLIGISVALETTGITGVILLPYPSRLFAIDAHALTIGAITGVLAWAVARRGAVDEAFDLGVYAGERRARRGGRSGPVVVDLELARQARETAGA